MKNSAWRALLMGFSVLLASSVRGGLEARGCRPDLIPNGGVHRCSNCHVSSRGGGRRTPFGQDVRDFIRGSSCAEFWEAELAALDSDGDGRSNGEELLDPSGSWRPQASPCPGDSARVTNPGVSDDPPPALPVLFIRGDSNSSGTVDISDGVFTLGFLFLGGRQPPAPYPECGVDAVEETPGCEVSPGNCQ